MQIASNDSAMIVGFFFRPLEKAYQPPAYADRSGFKQTAMFIQTDSMHLPAVLTMPAKTGKWPVLIFIGGSGPNDKDETLGAEKPFRDLAMGLGVNGIASLRFDKRSLAYPGNFKSKNYTLTDEYLEDIKNAITDISHIDGIDTNRIYLLGHSMGGMIAPLILKENKIFKGAVMLEANARPLQELVLEQMKYLSLKDTSKETSSGNIEQIKKQVAAINNITIKDSSKEYLGAKGSYWLSLKKYNQVMVASRLESQKLLIIQGGEDYQVNNTDFQLWKKQLNGKTNVQFNFLEKIDHALVEGNGSMSPSEYNIPKNVPKYLVDLIADWINKK
jgi:esterase/lipase